MSLLKIKAQPCGTTLGFLHDKHFDAESLLNIGKCIVEHSPKIQKVEFVRKVTEPREEIFASFSEAKSDDKPSCFGLPLGNGCAGCKDEIECIASVNNEQEASRD